MKKRIHCILSILLLSYLASSQEPERLLLRSSATDSSAGKTLSGLSPIIKTTSQAAKENVTTVVTAGTSSILSTGTDVQVNDNTGAMTNQRFTQAGNTITANGSKIVIAFDDAGSYNGVNTHFTGFAYSNDFGATFTDGGTLPPGAQGDAGFPSLALNLNTNRTYLLTLPFNGNGLQLFRSDDYGVTWMPAVNPAPGGGLEDKPWITCDFFPGAGSGNVYIVSRRFSGAQGIYLFRSTDHGNTFTPGGGTFIASSGNGAYVVNGPDHSVYVFWHAGTTLMMRKSTDLGITFGPAITVASGLAGGINGDLALTGIRQGTSTPANFRTNGFPSVVINHASGHIYVTYANNPPGSDKGDIFFVMSSDGGNSFTPPIKINDDLTTTDQWKPTIAVIPIGTSLGVFYYSRHEDPVNNNLFRFYGRLADISGSTVTFGPSFAISDVLSLPEMGRDAVVNSTYMGDYDQALGVNGGFHVVWSDNRDDLPGGAPRKDPNVYHDFISLTPSDPTVFYSKPGGDLHMLSTWGNNPDGSGPSPSDFGFGKTFHLVNRGGFYLMTGDWTVEGMLNNTQGGPGGTPAGGQLVINGFTLSEAGMIGGTLTGSNSSNLTITGIAGGEAGPLFFTPGGEQLNNLRLMRPGGSLTIITPLEVFNHLEAAAGTLTIGSLLTLNSDASNTARVLPIPIGSAAIIGNVQVERYIPARRAWRILSAPVGTTGQTIQQAWQEGTTNVSPVPNPFPGFGTHITGGAVFGSVANGFDQNPGAATSIKFYNSSVDNWSSQPNTNATPVGGTAWMLFVRGDRGIALSTTAVPPTPTTLRAIGPLRTGTQNFIVNPTGFTAIGNPYASPVDFSTMLTSNVQNSVWLWDPKLGGAFGVGGYVNVSYNGSGWDATPTPVSAISQIIQNGQGFLVKTISPFAFGTLSIRETDKSMTPNMDVFRPALQSTSIRIRLQSVNSDGTASLIDEVLSSHGRQFSAKVDEMDAEKPSNIEENLAILKEGKELMVDRRPFLLREDEIQLKFRNLAEKSYQLLFNPERLSDSLTLWLIDEYLQSVTSLSIDRISTIDFIVNADPASFAPHRFRLVLSPKKPSPEFLMNEGLITAYPNPVSGNRINLQFINKAKGTYQLSIVNSIGQVVFKKAIQHNGGSVTQLLQLDKVLQEGVYQLQLEGENGKTNIKLLVK